MSEQIGIRCSSEQLTQVIDLPPRLLNIAKQYAQTREPSPDAYGWSTSLVVRSNISIAFATRRRACGRKLFPRAFH
jgi:hypothetical protein